MRPAAWDYADAGEREMLLLLRKAPMDAGTMKLWRANEAKRLGRPLGPDDMLSPFSCPIVPAGIEVGRMPFNPENPPDDRTWHLFLDAENVIGFAPLPTNANQLQVFVRMAGDANARWRVMTFPLAADAAGITLRDVGSPFPPCARETLWFVRHLHTAVWGSKAPMKIKGPFDPRKLVLPVASCTSTSSGKTYRMLRMDRVGYGGRPVKFVMDTYSATVVDPSLEGADNGLDDIWRVPALLS